MADSNRLMCRDIPFLIDGVAKIVKSVNKQTTCNDVINKLANPQCSLAVFEFVNGKEQELPGNTKLLKAWRSHGPSDSVVFVVKKSEHTVLKRSKSAFRTEFKAHRRNSKLIARESLKKETDLAFYVRYQKTKVQNMKRKFAEMDNTGEDRAKKVMKHFTSSSSMDSMDAFLAKTDLEKMSRFLSFCGGVTDHHLGLRQSSNTPREKEVLVSSIEKMEEMKQVYTNNIQTSITNMKLGLKQKFLSKNKPAKRTTSTGTISSTDSGYKSVTSEGQGNEAKEHHELTKRPTFMDSNLGDAPRHSTPMITRSFGKVESESEDNDSFNISFYDEIEGKDTILKRFMADQERMAKEIDSRASIGCYGLLPEIEDNGRPSRFSLPAFMSQKEKYRYLVDKNCNSDSDTSSVANDSAVWNASQLDNAFIDSFEDIPSIDFVTPRNRTLRRESAMSNLNKCSLRAMPVDTEDDFNSLNYSFDIAVINSFKDIPSSDCVTPRNKTLRRESAMSNLNKFSLLKMPVHTEDDHNSFNYSFDCTFPRMDESQSVDFSGGFGEGFTHVNDNFGNVTFDGDSEDNVTRELLKDICDDTVVDF